MLATIPNHPIIAGTNPYVINRIEYASVPMENKICANEKLELFVLRILRPNSINEFFSASLVPGYCFSNLRIYQ